MRRTMGNALECDIVDCRYSKCFLKWGGSHEGEDF